MRLPDPARLAARVIHAVTVAYRDLDAKPAPVERAPAYTEQTSVAATTQVNTDHPPRTYRGVTITRPYAQGGIGFTGDPRG